MKKLSILFIAVILLMCIAPVVGMVALGPSQPAANEALADAPKLKTAEGGVNFAYLSDLKDYINDRFRFRQELITAGHRLSAALFRSTGEEDVILGRDGWLFYASTLDDYMGSGDMGDREYYAAARNLSLIYEYCSARGIRFLFTCAPNKNSLYGQYMPETFAQPAGNAAGELYAVLDGLGVPYLDLRQVFTAREETVYFAHDSHWTSRGAALAADAICAALQRPTAYFDGPFTETPHSGDLYEMVYPAGEDDETDLTPADEPAFTYGPGGTRPDSITVNTQSSGSGRLFMYRDSFGNSLYPYMAGTFAEARFSRDTAYDMTEVSASGADTLVIELVERNIDWLLEYPPVLPAPERDLDLGTQRRGQITLTAGEGPLEGFLTVSGILPEEVDATSPVLVQNSAGTFEAALTADGFRAVVPAAAGPWAAAFAVEGQLAVYEGV